MYSLEGTSLVKGLKQTILSRVTTGPDWPVSVMPNANFCILHVNAINFSKLRWVKAALNINGEQHMFQLYVLKHVLQSGSCIWVQGYLDHAVGYPLATAQPVTGKSIYSSWN